MLSPAVRVSPIGSGVRRLIAIGLVGLLALALAGMVVRVSIVHTRHVTVVRPAPAVTAPPGPGATAIVDVSYSGVRDPLDVIGLGPRERIVAIDGRAATTADLAAVWRGARAGGYLDLDVLDAGRLRRMIVLVHP